jgi:hypothetical protein
MSIECRPSNLGSDVRCEVCGQGFFLYGDRSITRERRAVHATVQQMLRNQHDAEQHPEAGFVVEWKAESVLV